MTNRLQQHKLKRDMVSALRSTFERAGHFRIFQVCSVARPRRGSPQTANMSKPSWNSINRRVVACSACQRLRSHCQEVARVKRRAYADDTYWGRPVPNFGDPGARLLIVGLAPGAHGANRTGRMFTGDRSGDWLYRALADAGFANQSTSVQRDDGLELDNCAITAVCHCAPPQNKPTRDEIEACRPFLAQTIDVLPVRVFLALGQLAWKATVAYAFSRGWLEGKRPRFGHGAIVAMTNDLHLIGSYHPSQQNTFTGKLTREMLDDVLSTVQSLLNQQAAGGR